MNRFRAIYLILQLSLLSVIGIVSVQVALDWASNPSGIDAIPVVLLYLLAFGFSAVAMLFRLGYFDFKRNGYE